MDCLTDRQKKLLKIVVERYVETGEPVSSSYVASFLNCSSATIRNELHILEEKMLCVQPHTSAGRIPTNQAFRYYINNLMSKNTLPENEKEIIDSSLETSENLDISSYLNTLSDMLVSLTRYAILSSVDSKKNAIVASVEFVQISKDSVYILVITDVLGSFGHMVHMPYLVTIDVIAMISKIVNEFLKNEPVYNITDDYINSIAENLNLELQKIINPVLVKLCEIFKTINQSRVMISGMNSILKMDSPSKDDAIDAFEYFSEKGLTLFDKLYNEKQADSIYIGEETGEKDLANFSLILVNYDINSDLKGSLGLLGPARMDYGLQLSRLSHSARVLAKYLSKDK